MDQVVHTILRFEGCSLDPTRGSPRTGEQDIDQRPKAFEVLRHLAQNAGRLVSKQEIYDAVWQNIVVSDVSPVQCVRGLRQKLGGPSANGRRSSLSKLRSHVALTMD